MFHAGRKLINNKLSLTVAICPVMKCKIKSEGNKPKVKRIAGEFYPIIFYKLIM